MILIALASFAAAQAIEVEPGTPPEVASAFQAWAGCVMERAEADDGTHAPRRAANAILAACADRQVELGTAHGRWVDASSLSERAKRDARRSMARSVGELRGQVAAMIRAMRED